MTSAVMLRRPSHGAGNPFYPRLNHSHPLADGLIACWPLVFGGKNFLGDLTHKHPLALGGTLPDLEPSTDRRVGVMRTFYDSTTTTDHFLTPVQDTTALTVRPQLSIMIGYSRTSTPTTADFAILVGKRDSGSDEYTMMITDAGRPRFDVFSVTPTSGSSVGIGAFAWICGVYDGAAVRLYVNGTQRASAAATGTINVANDLFIGGGSGFSAGTFDCARGKMCLICIWDRALSPTTVFRMRDLRWPFGLVTAVPRILHVENPAVGGAFIPAFARNANTLISTGGPM